MCMIESADDCCTAYREETPVARKPHKCGECLRTVQPGERYLRVNMLSRRDFSSAVLCGQCAAAGEWLVAVCGGYLLDFVLDDLEGHLEMPPPIRSLSLHRLARWMRQAWRRPDGTLVPVADVERWAKAGVAMAGAHAS